MSDRFPPRVTWKQVPPGTGWTEPEVEGAQVLAEYSLVPDTRVHPIWIVMVGTRPSDDGNGDVTIWYTQETGFEVEAVNDFDRADGPAGGAGDDESGHG